MTKMTCGVTPAAARAVTETFIHLHTGQLSWMSGSARYRQPTGGPEKQSGIAIVHPIQRAIWIRPTGIRPLFAISIDLPV